MRVRVSVGVRVCFIRPSRVIISSNNTSYDLNRKEFNVLLAVALLVGLSLSTSGHLGLRTLLGSCTDMTRIITLFSRCCNLAVSNTNPS